MGHDEAPPSYDSIFDQLKAQKEQSTGVVDYTKNASSVVKTKAGGACGTVMMICCLSICNLGLPIAEIVIGALYFPDCPAQRLLTIYLVVMGSLSCVSGLGSIGTKMAGRNAECNEEGEQQTSSIGKKLGCISGLINGFLACWFIAGNVFIFGMKKCDMAAIQTNATEECFSYDVAYNDKDFYCEKLVYDYVFYETIVRWALLGAGLVVCCSCCLVMMCVFCCSSKK